MKAFRTISSIALAVLVLVSSTSFMMGVHRCMGEVQDIAFFSEAEACENEKELPPCHRPANPCCEDETLIHQGDDFKASLADLPVPLPASVDSAEPVVFISEIVPSPSATRIKYSNYDPPLRSYDLTIDHQVFLI